MKGNTRSSTVEPIIQARNIHKTFRNGKIEVHALRGVDLSIEAGEMVALMPQGTIPRGKAFFEPKLTGRWGAARLAAMTGAPVIPVGPGAPRRCGPARPGCPTC